MIDLAFRGLFTALSLLGRRLTIVMFHRVMATPDPLLPDENDRELFTRRLDWLHSNFTILTLSEAVASMGAGRLPRRSLVITFDDGYADNAENALPILNSRGARATFFVTTRFVDGGMMWNDRVIEAVRAWRDDTLDPGVAGVAPVKITDGRAAAVDSLLNQLKYLDYSEREAISDELLERSGSAVRNLMMNAAQIRSLHQAGMEIGAHTHSHPIMARLDEPELREEIITNKTRLETIIDAPVRTFAYPNGRADQDYHHPHTGLLAELGFDCAVTTMAGAAADLDNRFEIPRFSPWDRSRTRYLARLAQNYLRPPTYAAHCAD